MNDQAKTKTQLIEELAALRQRLAELEALEGERRQTEANLQESLQRYKELVDNLPVGVYRNTPGPDGQLLEANPFLVATFEADSKEEFLQYKVSDFYQNPEDRQAFIAKMERFGLLKSEDLRLKTLKR